MKAKVFNTKKVASFKTFVSYYYGTNYKDFAYQLVSAVLNSLITSNGELLVSVFSNKVLSSIVTNISIDRLDEIKNKDIEKMFRRFSKATRAKKKVAELKRLNSFVSLDKEDITRNGILLVEILYKSGANLFTIYNKGVSKMCKLSDDVQALLFKTEAFFINNSVSREPLVIPPKDWTGYKGTGGYYTRGNRQLIKTKGTKHSRKLEPFVKNISKLLTTINKLQKVPYKINKKILDVVSYIIDNNIVSSRSSPQFPFLIGNIPYMDKLDVVVDMKEFDVFTKEEEINNYNYALYKRACNLQERRGMKSTSKALQFKMAYLLAKKFSSYEKIYFSYDVDFRGRLYPIQQNLNPQAPENIKPLMMFAEGELLTTNGLYWLKIQGANTYGYDKLSFTERIEKIDSMLDDIIHIANDPLSTLHLWDMADEPLQFLTFCFSYRDYLDGKPVHIPVYLDGTCSGIQHYSGLLLDGDGAKATNVISNGTDNPSDIYKEVALEGKKVIEEGNYTKEYYTKDGTSHKTYRAAMEIYHNMSRKLTKRNVMTQPYSVTYMGMVNQNDALLEEYIDANDKWWTQQDWIISKLLAEINNTAITRVVKGAKVGQAFLKETLRDKCKDVDYVLWYTPIFNFPVMQRIKKEKETRLFSPFGNLTLYSETDETHRLKMANGIAPNYIHSLDATHLYLTVSNCQDIGINNFMLIHDSFGVTPNSVVDFNKIVRDSFIQLYETRPLEKWYKDITKEELPDGILINTLDLGDIKQSKYIFA